MNKKMALLVLCMVQLQSCTTEKKGSSLSIEDSLRLVVRDSIARVTQDSIKKAALEVQEYLNKPWKAGYFTDEYGEPTNKKFLKTTVVGNFSNSATSNAYLLAEVLIEKSAAGIFLHEYKDQNAPQKFIGTARIKMKNSEGKELQISTSSSWNQSGGILIKNFTMVKGAESYDFSNFKNFIKKSAGEIKVVIYDSYSSSYRFSIDSKGFSDEFDQLRTNLIVRTQTATNTMYTT